MQVMCSVDSINQAFWFKLIRMMDAEMDYTVILKNDMKT